MTKKNVSCIFGLIPGAFGDTCSTTRIPNIYTIFCNSGRRSVEVNCIIGTSQSFSLSLFFFFFFFFFFLYFILNFYISRGINIIFCANKKNKQTKNKTAK